MEQNIHSTALVSKSANLGKNVKIGPYTIIEDNVVIGDNTEIRSHCVIGKDAIIGENNTIYSSVIIGTDPQDKKYNGEKTHVKVGNNNIIREFCTINKGTAAHGETYLGNDNMLLAYSHIAHDCIVGNNIIMSNATQLGGHVEVEDWVVFGAFTKVHQFCKIGCHVMTAADVIITKDVPPYILSDRKPAFHGLNIVGLKRRGFEKQTLLYLNEFYKYLILSGYNNSDGIKKYIEDKGENNIIDEIKHCIDFVKNSERGIIR